jgi:predicted Zn finger-like uncharacterized protein
MRIDCEQCSAAFTIDDAMISDRGVRAQCPKCGHQRVVKKVAAANPFGALPAAGANPFGAPPAAAAPNPFGAPPAAPSATANPFAAAAAPNPFGAPSAAPSATANPFGDAAAPNPFGASPAAPSAAANPFAAAAAPNPFGAPHAAPSATADPFGAVEANPFGPSGAPPSAQGKAANAFGQSNSSLAGTDPFAALSTSVLSAAKEKFEASDRFRQPSASRSIDPFAGLGSGTAGAASPAAPARQAWTLQANLGDETLDLSELRERIKAGAVGPDDLCGPAGEGLKPARAHGALVGAFGLPKAADKPRVVGARATGFTFSVPRPVLAAVGALALIVGGVVVVAKVKPELFEKQSEAGINPLRSARPLWQRQFPDVEGTAQEHFVDGRQQMQLDTAAGYRKADDELRQSLLLDVGNTAAVAAWAENFTNLPTARADVASSTLARQAIEYALKKEPDHVELLRAQAALQLSLGEVDEAQRTLTRAKSASPGDMETLVLLARSHLERSPGEALAIIQRDVRAKIPDLKVAYTIEGAAQRRLGAFKEARELLQARLVTDAANVGALKEVAKLELDLGHADAALKALNTLLDAEDKDVEAHLLRAKITYQIKGGTDGLTAADAQLAEILAKHEGAAGEQLLLLVLTHATIVKTRLGQVDEAIKLGQRAITADATFPSALYALGRAYVAKGDLDNAKRTLEQAVRATEQREQFYEPLVRAELAAVQARAGDEQNAVRNNEKVAEYDPRNLRAFFSLAATYMKNGKAAQAMTIMRRALTNDPAWERDRQVLTDFPTLPADLIVYADAFRDARLDSKDESIGSLRNSAEGVIRYHAGDRDKASALFLAALRMDRNNDAALLYQGIIDLDAGRVADGRKLFRTAVDSTAGRSPVTRLYLARADLLSGDVESARSQLQEIVDTEPTLVQARYSLAMVLRAQKLEAQATNELKAVVRQDPDFLPAKQALADKG